MINTVMQQQCRGHAELQQQLLQHDKHAILASVVLEDCTREGRERYNATTNSISGSCSV